MSDLYFSEILEQPVALRRVLSHFGAYDAALASLSQRARSGMFRRVILTGMGSSYYACYPIWQSLWRQGYAVALWEASELLHFAPECLDADTLLIAVSQSGESVEMRRLIELGRRPATVVAITNDSSSSLARWADVVLDIQAGKEETVSTKTYLNSLAVLHLLSLEMLGEEWAASADGLLQVAEVLENASRVWPAQTEEAARFLGRCDSLAFIARGPSIASAFTGALITKEACKIFTDALSAGQFRHGPLELARAGFQAVIFAGNPATSPLNSRLALEIAAHGGQSLLITSTPHQGSLPQGVFEWLIPPALSELLPLIEIVPVQWLTIPLAIARGFHPGAFEYGGKVTALE